MAVTTTGASLAGIALISAGMLFVTPAADDSAYPTIHPNDNRLPAGTTADRSFADQYSKHSSWGLHHGFA